MSSQIHKGDDSLIRKMQFGFPPGIRERLALDYHSEWQCCWEVYEEKAWIKSAALTNQFLPVFPDTSMKIFAAHALSC